MLGDQDADRLGKKSKADFGGHHGVSEDELGVYSPLFGTCPAAYQNNRGVSKEEAHDGGPHGQLCGHRSIGENTSLAFVISIIVPIT